MSALSQQNWLTKVLFFLVIAYALTIRLMMCHQGLPYLRDYDEPFILNFALDALINGNLNPGRFHYGTAIIYLSAASGAVNSVILKSLPESSPSHIDTLQEVIPGFDGTAWSISHPSFYLASRISVTLFGVGWVFLCYVIVRKLSGEWAGLAAAVLISFSPEHVALSGITRTDVPMGFFALAMIAAAVSFEQKGAFKFLGWAAFFAGLATAFKFNGAIFCTVPPILLLRANLQNRLPFQRQQWLLVLTLPVLAFIMLTPFSVLDFSTFYNDIFKELDHYAVRGHGDSTSERGIPHMLFQAGVFWKQWGLQCLFALGGMVALTRRRDTSVVVGSLGLYLFFMTMMRVNFHRNFVHGHALLAMASAVALVSIVSWLRERRSWNGNAIAVVTSIIWLGFALPTAIETTQHCWHRYTHEDTRTASIDVINALAKENGWSRIGMDALLRYHPLDLRRLEVAASKDTVPSLLTRADEFDAFVFATGYKLVFMGHLQGLVNQSQEAIKQEFEEVRLIPGNPLFVDISTENPEIRVVLPPR